MLGFALFPMHAAAIALGGFGLLALMLAVTGIYGLIAYAVARRTRELGIRLALGAQRSSILQLVLGNVTRLLVAGLMAGCLLALAAGSVLSAVIFGASATDPQVFCAVGIALLAATGTAGLGPTLRAVRTDAMSALRYQ